MNVVKQTVGKQAGVEVTCNECGMILRYLDDKYGHCDECDISYEAPSNPWFSLQLRLEIAR